MRTIAALLTVLVCVPAVAMKNRQRNFVEPCEVVWSAAVTVAKSQDYRIITISKEEQIISVAVGGFLAGERIITLTLAPDPERGCVATVQSRFSGLAHSDGPALLGRVRVELLGETMDRKSKAFRDYKDCVDFSPRSDADCEKRLRRKVAKGTAQMGDESWWQLTPKEQKP